MAGFLFSIGKYAPFSNAPFTTFKVKVIHSPQVIRCIARALASEGFPMKKSCMAWIHGVFHALKPIAVEYRLDFDFAWPILSNQKTPPRKQRLFLRGAHV